ncbi:MAG: VIT1/CCC1 transporter family protein [Candidatus Bathyarchaeia archaeon]
MLEKLSDLREYVKFSGISEISRRYFVMNTFDGALTMLGIVVGSYTYGKMEVRMILGAGLGASLAMAISGLSGAYMAERAERRRGLQELEKAMLRDMENSLHARAMKIATLWVALVDGGAPLIAGVIALTPFLLAVLEVMTPLWAVYSSIAIIMSMLFLLGIFLGRISREKLIISGVKTLAIGLATAAIILFVGGI